MASGDNRKAGFTVQGAQRIVNATRWTEQQPRSHVGPPATGGAPYRGMWVKITGSTLVSDDSGTYNKYDWTKQIRLFDGLFDDHPDGTTSSASDPDTRAINSAELDPSQPIPTGTILRCRTELDEDDDGNPVSLYTVTYAQDTSFYAIIASSATMGTNKWTYVMNRAKPSSTTNDWTVDTSDTTDYVGWNLSESINSDTGEQGNGITVGDGITILPAPDGLPRLVRPGKDCDGNPIVTFEYENGIDLTCASGG